MDVYAEWAARFRYDLEAAGFQRVDIAAGMECWDGILDIEWDDSADGTRRAARHPIRIGLPSGFPCQRPAVSPRGDSQIRNSRHQAPGDRAGTLCLWPEDDRGEGWMPWTTAEGLIERVRDWFVRYHRDDWAPRDRPPDLHLYFPTNSTRCMMITSEDWAPPREAAHGRFGVWVSNEWRAFAGAPQAGANPVPRRHQDRLLAELRLKDRDRAHVGLWFRLPREPRPIPVLTAMLRQIGEASGHGVEWVFDVLRGHLGERLPKGEQTLILALGYPDPSDAGNRERWLFLRATVGRRPEKVPIKPSALEKVPVESYEAAPAGRQALLRRTKHTSAALDNARAVVFGVGALGGHIAVLLAKAGVPSIDLVDGARLRPGNAIRHVAGLYYAGYPKTVATQMLIEQHMPDCIVKIHQPTWDPEALDAIMRGADVVIDATANPAYSLLTNRVCLAARVGVVYATVHRRALIGRVRLVRPGRDACPICYEHFRAAGTYPVIPPGPEGEFVEEGCGVPTIEASAVDVESVANQSARVALEQLRGISGEANHWFIVNGPLGEGDPVFQRPGIDATRWEVRPECGACGALVAVA